MTQDEILSMPAGWEMDLLLATRLEPPTFAPPDYTNTFMADMRVHERPMSPLGFWLATMDYETGDVPRWEPIPLSTDISAAWLVVEKMYHGDTTGFQIIRWPSNDNVDWIISFGNGQHGLYAADADNAPLAICRAALLATLPKMV